MAASNRQDLDQLDLSTIDVSLFEQDDQKKLLGDKKQEPSIFSSSAQTMLSLDKQPSKKTKTKTLADVSSEEVAELLKTPAQRSRTLQGAQSQEKKKVDDDTFLNATQQPSRRPQPCVEIGEGTLDLSKLQNGNSQPRRRQKEKTVQETQPLLEPIKEKPFEELDELHEVVQLTRKMTKDKKFSRSEQAQLDAFIAEVFVTKAYHQTIAFTEIQRRNIVSIGYQQFKLSRIQQYTGQQNNQTTDTNTNGLKRS